MNDANKQLQVEAALEGFTILNCETLSQSFGRKCIPPVECYQDGDTLIFLCQTHKRLGLKMDYKKIEITCGN